MFWASILSLYQVVLIAWSLYKLSKLIGDIQVAWHRKVEPDRSKVIAIITVYMAKLVTNLLCSVLIFVAAFFVNDPN